MSIYLLDEVGQKSLISFTEDHYYLDEIHIFEATKMGCALFVDEESEVDTTLALLIGYAMLNEKPIVLPTNLHFSTTLFMRELILKRSNKIILADVKMLGDEDQRAFFKSISSSNLKYSFNKHERILLQAALRTYFKALITHHSPYHGLIALSRPRL